MPCCMAKEDGWFDWCQGLAIVHKNEDGKEYCLFHAPAEHKGISLQNFNEEIFRRIREAKRRDKNCDLSGTVFPGDIVFICDDMKIPSLPPIDFEFATFSSGVNFRQATFDSMADFNHTEFNGMASFMETTFSDRAYFYGARFKGKALFDGAIFKGSTIFDKVIFRDTCTFEGAIIRKTCVFDADTTFKVVSHLRDIDIQGRLNFIGTKVSNLSFLGTDLRKIEFKRPYWAQQKKTSPLLPWVSWSYDVLYDEIIADELYRNRKLEAEENWVEYYEKVEDLYRQLKQKNKEDHNEPLVSKWHFREKEVFRKKSLWRRRNPLSFTNLYWAFSGYGERPLRAMIMLLALLAGITTLMNLECLGIISPSGETIKGFSWSLNLRKLGLCLKNTFEYSLFIKTPKFEAASTLGGIILLLTTKILIPLQGALFAFSLRNKFRR